MKFDIHNCPNGAIALIYKNKPCFLIETDRVKNPADWLYKQFNHTFTNMTQLDKKTFIIGNNITGEPHHLAHAYAAYSQSGFKNASILVIDGSDSNFLDPEIDFNECHSISIYKACNNTIETVRKYTVKTSLGSFYAWGVHRCGFGTNHRYAGKLMGASSYGVPMKNYPHFLLVDQNTGDILEESNLFTINDVNNQSFGNTKLAKIIFGYEVIQNEYSFDFTCAQKAATIQRMFEESVFSLLRYIRNTLPSNNLVLTGGCALNCVCNGKIIRSGMFDDLFIPNMCEDQGNVIGRIVMELGQEVSKPYIYNNVTYPVPKEYHKQISKEELANKIRNGQIVAWFEGGSEYGPRALCHRSILGNPELRWMANRLNEIKRREYWRPLAPVVLDTHFKKFFDVDGRIWAPHKVMLATEYLRPEYQRKFQAVCAPDNSSRPQVLLDTRDNHTLYSLMKDYDLPILVNTSMNGANEPICETPENAIEFASRNSDVLLVFVKGDKLYIKE